jgi:ATP-dependent Clp protease, protease subunit
MVNEEMSELSPEQLTEAEEAATAAAIEVMQQQMQASLSAESERRVIKVFDEINSEAAFMLWSAIRAYEFENPTAPIQFFLNSPGGSIHSMFAMVDAMLTTSCPIITIGTGIIMSAAVPILAAGDKGSRYITPHTRLLLHQQTGGQIGSQSNIRVAFEESEVLHNMHKDLLKRLTKINKTTLNKIMENPTDYYFGVDEALKFGIADHIFERMPV